MKLTLMFLLSLTIGCGSIQRLGVRTMSPILKEGGELLTHERNWDFFKDSTPANLKFLELLYLQDQNNLKLLSLLIKGYAGYAYAVPETLLFEEELKGNDGSHWKRETLDFYTRAFDYGLSYLEKQDITSESLLNLEESKLLALLQKELNEDDLVSVLYFAQSWGSLIQQQKDNVALVAQVPRVKVLFDWVCGIQPNIEHGVCDIFYAQYEASRPKMLGGDPVKAEELYLSAIKKRPHHLLIRLGYIQYLLIPSYDQEKYEAIAKDLVVEFLRWEDLNREQLKNTTDYKDDHHLNLYNAIAKKRFEIVEKNKNTIF